MAEKAALRPPMGVVVIRNIPHVVVDIDLAELRRRYFAKSRMHVGEMVRWRCDPVISPHDHGYITHVAFRDPADLVLVVPGCDLGGSTEIASLNLREGRLGSCHGGSRIVNGTHKRQRQAGKSRRREAAQR